MTSSRSVYAIFLCCLFSAAVVRAQSSSPSAGEVVLYASTATPHGNWEVIPDGTAAGGSRLANADRQADRLTGALAEPVDYFELTFRAVAGTPYRLWIRGIAADNSYWNDSVFVQFSDSVTATGVPWFRIGSTAAAVYTVEDCTYCGTMGWGWNDTSYGPTLADPIYFATTGEHTIRIQMREDGLSIDQIVLSPAAFFVSAPGALKNDHVILAASDGDSSTLTTFGPSWEGWWRDWWRNWTMAAPATSGDTPPVIDTAADGLRVGSLDGARSAPATLVFTASASASKSTDQLTYTWDFGDGSTPERYVQTPEPSSQNAVHTYTKGGTYVATVTITDQRGNRTAQAQSVTIAPGPPVDPATTLKVLQWNVYKGRSSDTRAEQSRIWLQARWMAAINPDVIVLEEVMGAGMAEKYRAELQRLLPKSAWSYVFSSDNGTDSQTSQGVAILTRSRIQRSESMAYHPCFEATVVQRAALAATIRVNGRDIVIIGTHLSSYSADADKACRTAQAERLVAWGDTLGPARILTGDLNADPHEDAMAAHLLRDYRDTWDDTTHRTAYPDNPSAAMATRSERIDYVLTSRGAPLDLVAIQVPDTRDMTNHRSIPVEGQARRASLNEAPRASDHEMLIATFRVR